MSAEHKPGTVRGEGERSVAFDDSDPWRRLPPSSRIIPGMAVVAGHHNAVRELRPVPRARLFLAGERLELEVLVAGIFSEAPQVCVKGFCGGHAGEWGRAEHAVVWNNGRDKNEGIF